MKSESKPDKAEPKEKLSLTHDTVRIGGRKFKYTAATGILVLKTEDDKPKASFFFIAYTLDDTHDLSRRPITFSFNGGPGSSSVWLHLGVLGP
ncbi:MAG: peptidase S10, partial [Verrucomicrobia bacterium]|nr:peptidase S10 [Verrucomicrobiota bacterium]